MTARSTPEADFDGEESPPRFKPSGYATVNPAAGALAIVLMALILAHAGFVAGWLHVAWQERHATPAEPRSVPRRMRWIVRIRDRCRVPRVGPCHTHGWDARVAAEQRVSVFACGAAILVVAAWLLQLGFVWFADTLLLPLRVPGEVALLRDAALGSILLAVPFGFPFLLRPRRDGARFVPFRIVPLAAGLVALWHFWNYLDGPLWTGVPALLSFERAVSPGTFASPAMAILLLCAGLYAWGAWNTHRLALVSPPDPSSGLSSLVLGRASGCNLDDCVHEPLMRMRGWTSLLPLATLTVLLPAASRHAGSVEGDSFGGFLFFGAVCLATAFFHTLAHSVHLGRVLLEVLQSLERHPIAPAFARIGQQPFPWGLSFQRARSPDLQPLAVCAARLAESVAFLPPRSMSAVLAPGYGQIVGRRESDAPPPLLAPQPPAWTGDGIRPTVGEQARALELGARVGDLRSMEALRMLPHAVGEPAGSRIEDSVVWKELAQRATSTVPWLARAFWTTSLRDRGDDDPRARCCRQAETLVAFQVAIVVRDMLRRLVSGLSLAMGGLVLLTTLHLVYAFQGRRFWLAFDWVALGVAAVLAVTILVDLEKNAVLSRLWATRPGRVSFSGGLIYRIVGYAAVPVLMLFGTVFPELIGNLAGWVERIRPPLP